MTLISLVIILAIVGVVLYLVNSYIPMDATIKKIINIAAVIAVVLWLLKAFGLLSGLSAVTVG